MTAAVAITREDLDAAGLRREAARTRDADAARRMLALALVLEGWPRAEAARLCGIVEPRGSPGTGKPCATGCIATTTGGVAGLSDKPLPGPARRLTPEQEAAVAELVREGPDLDGHGVVRWRRQDLARVIEARFGVSLAGRTVGTLLRRLGFRRLSARPRHPGHDAAAQASFRPALPAL